MDSALRPRDIQARIRSGRSVDEVASAAGMSAEMVQRFAAPVLAEREYVAGQAMTAPVRRRGESSARSKLRVAVSERLMGQRVDIDQVEWDSARMEDGRWAVVAAYQVAEARREAVFHFDVPGRFSVAGNSEARWLLGEDVDSADDEPTVDLAAEPPVVVPPERGTPVASQPADQHETTAPAVAEQTPEPVVALVPEAEPSAQPVPTERAPNAGGLDMLYDILDRSGTEYTEDSVELSLPVDAHLGDAGASQTGASQTGMSQTGVSQTGVSQTGVSQTGVSDAAAVPETAATDYSSSVAADDYPVEPSLFDSEPEFAAPAQADPPSRNRRRSRATVPEVDLTAPAAHAAAVEPEDPAAATSTGSAGAAAAEPDPDVAPAPAPAPSKKPRSKRASVPSWDEIMFGSPRSKG